MDLTKLKEILKESRDSIDDEINDWIKDNGRVIDQRLKKNVNRTFNPYPDIGSDSFSKDISTKYEFLKSKYADDSFSMANCDSTTFKRTLNQEFVKNFLSPQTPYNSLLLFHGVGVGKCFEKGTRILMFDASWKRVEDICVGDQVMGDDSTLRNVTSVVRGRANMFRVVPEWGKDYVVNGDHILCCKKLINGDIYEDYEISVNDYLKLPKDEREHLFGYRAKLVFFADILTCSTYHRMLYLRELLEKSGIIKQDYIEVRFDIDGYHCALSCGIGCFRRNDKMYMFGRALRYVLPDLPFDILNRSVFFKFQINELDGERDYYGFSVDANHKFIINDFIVTHNSCSAIMIAEQFQNVFDKKSLVLMPPNLKENFMKQIFNIKNPERSCTKTTYYNPEKYIGMSMEMIEKKVYKLINNKYEIKGFIEFANYVNNLSKNEKQKIQLIREQFSDRVIIIDEVHNIRDEEKTDKFVPPIIKDVLRYANNVKLVLLSATPMYNKASEIIELVNFLRINDKKKPIDQNDIFDKSGETLKPNGKEILRRSITGYVSYMRGENPFTFPMRLFPNEATDKFIKELQLVPCKMSKFQADTYSSVFENDETAFKKNIQISNICYPTREYGKAGLNSIFDITENPFALEYKANEKKIFSKENIGIYSAKIDYIVNKILNSEGIIFIYSFYIWSGIIPLALALEHRGFRRYGLPNLITNPGKVDSSSNLTYTILTPQRNLSPNVDSDLEICKSKENANAEKIKVVIASSIASEGFDFKNIREVYILEPWWHLNKIEQIIGRAVRNCSHIDLPPEKRNVTIYQLINVSPEIANDDQIDIRMYKVSSEKQRTMNEVEDILKETSIDCHLNSSVMFYNTKKKIDIINSQKIKSTVSLRDDEKRYKKIMCYSKGEDEEKNKQVDKSTYDTFFFKDEIENMSEKISILYKDQIAMSYDDILKSIDDDDKKEHVLPFILNYLIDFKVPIGDKKGYLIYRGNVYVYQPFDNSNLGLPLEDRKNPKKQLRYGLRIKSTSSKKEKETKAKPSEQADNQTKSDIHKKISEEMEELKKRIKGFYGKFKSDIVLEYVLDRLSTDEVLELVLTKGFTKDMKKVLESSNTLISNENEIFIRDRTSDKIYSVDISSGSISEISEFQKTKLESLNKIKKGDNKKETIGYIQHEVNKKNNIAKAMFKIVDPDKKNSSGTVCYRTTTIQKNMLIDMILLRNKSLSNKDFDVSDVKKPGLCDIYELSLRSLPNLFSRS
jgi:superfamily II DNA or RNA helicase